MANQLAEPDLAHTSQFHHTPHHGKTATPIMSFQSFYESWSQHLQLHLQQLAAAPKPQIQEDQQYLTHLVYRVITHYDDYYRFKSQAAKQDVLSIFTAKWITSLERSLHWIGGWRPTIVFHLIYTESSIRFETQIIDFLRGRRSGDLGDLSPGQLGRVSELQCETVNEENEITNKLAEWQNGASEFVGLCSDMDGKMEGLVKVLEKADSLRLKTIKKMVEILNPLQAAEFLIAAGELQFGVQGWGLDKDNQRENM